MCDGKYERRKQLINGLNSEWISESMIALNQQVKQLMTDSRCLMTELMKDWMSEFVKYYKGLSLWKWLIQRNCGIKYVFQLICWVQDL